MIAEIVQYTVLMRDGTIVTGLLLTDDASRYIEREHRGWRSYKIDPIATVDTLKYESVKVPKQAWPGMAYPTGLN